MEREGRASQHHAPHFTFHVHICPIPREGGAGSFRLLPFDVPEGIVSLTVRYEYADPTDPSRMGKASGSVIDLGLFDPRGHEFLEGKGFRCC